MCLLAIQYRLVPEAPILVAANREEAYDRPWHNPSIQPGKPRVMCGVDGKAGGTWLGVNQNGLFVGASNRFKFANPTATRSDQTGWVDTPPSAHCSGFRKTSENCRMTACGP